MSAITTLTIRRYIEKRAKLFHRSYEIKRNGSFVVVSFCGYSVAVRLDSPDVCTDLAKEWCVDWTRLEQVDWQATLAHESRTGIILPDYPMVSRHFNVEYVASWDCHVVDIFSHIQYIRSNTLGDKTALINVVEAHLSQ